MGTPKQISINGMVFSTKGNADAYCSAMLNRYERKQRVNADDEPFLRALFNHHPDRQQKLEGEEISYFIVDASTGGTNCFYVVRSDNKLIDFSFKKCLDGAASSG